MPKEPLQALPLLLLPSFFSPIAANYLDLSALLLKKVVGRSRLSADLETI
jgi:hypothetical protein